MADQEGRETAGQGKPSTSEGNGYWHPKVIALVVSIGVALGLFAALFLLRKHEQANTYAEVLLVCSALYSGIVGIGGGTIENGKIAPAGWLVIVGVLFGFGVGFVQKTSIADAAKARADEEKRLETAAAARREKAETDRANKASSDLAKLQEEINNAKAAGEVNAKEAKAGLESVAKIAHDCSPAARKAIVETTRDLDGRVFYTGLLLHTRLDEGIGRVQQDFKKVSDALTKISDSVGSLPHACIDAGSLQAALNNADAVCDKRVAAAKLQVPPCPPVADRKTKGDAEELKDAGNVGLADLGGNKPSGN